MDAHVGLATGIPLSVRWISTDKRASRHFYSRFVGKQEAKQSAKVGRLLHFLRVPLAERRIRPRT